jgi:hypothetical protein
MKVRNANDDGWIEVGGDIPILQQDAEPATTYPGQLWLDTDAESTPDGLSGWRLVESKEFADDTLDWDITGLVGDTDRKYMLNTRLFENLSGELNKIYFTFNNDAAANYQWATHYFGTGHDQLFYNSENSGLLGSQASGDDSLGEHIFYVESGGFRIARGWSYRWNDNYDYFVTSEWNNTADEVTSIQITTIGSCAFKASFYKWVN